MIMNIITRHKQWHHGKRGQLPPTLSGVDFEISANPVRRCIKGVGVAMMDKYCTNFVYKHRRGNLHCHSKCRQHEVSVYTRQSARVSGLINC